MFMVDIHMYTHLYIQITYTPDVIVSTDASLSGRFQLYPSERNLVSALLAVVEEYNWTQISVLTQNEQPFIRVSIMNSGQHNMQPICCCMRRLTVDMCEYRMISDSICMTIIFCTYCMCLQVQKMVTEVFSTANMTVLPSSSFTTDQDVSNIMGLLVWHYACFFDLFFSCFNRLKTHTSILSTVLKTKHLNSSVG